MSNKAYISALWLFICMMLCTLSSWAQSHVDDIRKGNTYYNSADYKKAEDHYRKALSANDTSYKANFNLGDALYMQGRYEEAAKQFDKTVSLAKTKQEKGNAYYNQGNSLLKGNKLDQSIEAYKNALRLDPSNASARYNLSYAMLKKNRQKQQQNQQNQSQPQQNKDQQNKQNQQNQQQQNQPQPKPESRPQNNPQDINKGDADRMLDAVKKQEEELRKRLNRGGQDQPSKNGKPW